jgi:hypothetical protein
MTVINGIEIDNIEYQENIIKKALLNNEQIEEKLNVIIVISNPCQYARRYILAREFIKRCNMDEENINLYIVELIYNDQKYVLTEKNNKNHLQLKGTIPIWHKENMINLGVKYLLPKEWKAFAWIDADIEFESIHWVTDTLKLLNGTFDIVQLWSHCADLDKNKLCMQNFSSAGYQYIKNGCKYTQRVGLDFSHPGYAWACTRKAYEKMDGLYELSILGSGDHNMLLSLFGYGIQSLNGLTSDGYKQSIKEYENKVKKLRFGYVPGVIRHYFHGSKKNRKYSERWQILVENKFDPLIHITRDDIGLLIPTKECPKKLLDDIMIYFTERNEDEGFILLS